MSNRFRCSRVDEMVRGLIIPSRLGSPPFPLVVRSPVLRLVAFRSFRTSSFDFDMSIIGELELGRVCEHGKAGRISR